MDEVSASDYLETLQRLLARTDHVSMILRVSLTLFGQDPEVHFDLSQRTTDPNGERRIWKYPFGAIGAPSSLRQPPDDFSLPVQLIGELRDAVTAQRLPTNQPLWLDLIRPYGVLGALPWESVLGTALGRPILRLPSFLESPQEDGDIADVALLLCTNPTCNPNRTVWQVRSIASAVLGHPERLHMRVHIFAPKPWYDLLISEPFNDKRINLCYPPAPKREPVDLRSVWTDWISVSLGGQTVDAIHIIGDAEPTMTGALLSLWHPSRTLRNPVVTQASVEDFCTMLTRLGAWTAIITPPAQAISKRAAAFFADAVAHSRPGPLLYHRLKGEDDSRALADGYRFLLSPRPAHPPILSRGFLYGLPNAVAHVPTMPADEIAVAVAPALRSTEDIAVPPRQRLPNWASATERFIETARLDTLRRLSNDVLLSRAHGMLGNSDQETLAKGVELTRQTLSDIRGVVAEHLSSGTSAIASRPFRAPSRGRSSPPETTVVTTREAVIEIASSFDPGKFGVRLRGAASSHKNAMRFKSISLDTSKLPELDTPENVERYANQIKDALCSHEAVAAELTAIAKTESPAELRFIVESGPESEGPRWEAVSMRPDAQFLALKPECAVTRMAYTSDIRDPGIRTFSLPLRMVAFLSPANITAKYEFDAICSRVRAARQQDLAITCSIYLGEQSLLDEKRASIQTGELQGIDIAKMPPSAFEIEEVIRSQRPQLLHFFCHGKTEAGEHLLEFATINDWDHKRDRGSMSLTIERLRQVLISTGTTWLTVLNSCSGARAVDQIHSMALALAQNASPVTVGMAEQIEAADANLFVRAFYGRLFGILGTSLAAVAEGDETVLYLAPAIYTARAALHEEYLKEQNFSEPPPPRETFGRWCLPLLYERDKRLRVMRIPDEIKSRTELVAGALRSLPDTTPLAVRASILDKLPAELPARLRPDVFGNLV